MLMTAKKSVKTGLVASAVVSSCTRLQDSLKIEEDTDDIRVLCCNYSELGPPDIFVWVCRAMVVLFRSHLSDCMLRYYGH